MAYQAFISYSHAADDALAPALQQGLQSLARPWNRRRALEVFRDQTGLAVSPGLWSSIQAALDESEYFVLLASPEAAQSPWVDREIQHWLTTHSLERLLPVLTGGQWVWDPARGAFDPALSTSVPPSLIGRFSEEPRHLDLRWASSETELDLRNSRFRDAVSQLAAPMHAMTPQDLESADVRHYRRVVRLRRAVVTALSVLLILVSVAGVIAVRSSREARHQQDIAQQNAADADQASKRSLALQLVAQAQLLANEQKSLSLLLSLEASRLDPAQSWGSLIDGMAETPGLTKIVDMPAGFGERDATAIDPSGQILAFAQAGSGDIVLTPLFEPPGRRRVIDIDSMADEDSPELYPKKPDQLVFGTDSLIAAHYVCPRGAACGPGRRTPKIAVWDTERGEGRILPQSGHFESPVFDADGETLAALGPKGHVRVWDAETAALRQTFVAGSGGVPTAVGLSRDGTTTAVGERNGHVQVFRQDGSTRQAQQTLTLGTDEYAVQAALASRDTMVIRTQHGDVTVWDPRTAEPRMRLEHVGRTLDMRVSADGVLATAGDDGLLRLWDLHTLQQNGVGSPWSTEQDSIVDLTFTDDGQIVSKSSSLRFWDVEEWGTSGKTLYRGPAPVTAVAIGASGQLVSADADGILTLSAGVERRRSETGLSSVTALAVGDNGLVATGGDDGTVRLWDADTGEDRGILPGSPREGVAALAFREGGDVLAVGSQTGADKDGQVTGLPLRIWDVSEQQMVYDLPAGLAQDVEALVFNRAGILAVAGPDVLKVFEPSSGTTLPDDRVLVQSRIGQFTSVAFSPDGAVLAAAGHQPGQYKESPVRLWDPQRGAEQVAVPLEPGSALGGDGTFTALSYGPDGHLLVGAGSGGLQLWDVDRLEPIGGLLTASHGRSVAVDPEGQRIFVADEDGRVEAYPATVAGWRTLVCATVNRNLSQEEWTTYVGSDTPYEVVCPDYPGP